MKPDTEHKRDARWRELARGFFETARAICVDDGGAAGSGEGADEATAGPRPSESGVSVACVHLGLQAARERRLTDARAMADLPVLRDPVAAEAAAVLALEEGYDELKEELSKAAALSREGHEDDARALLGEVSSREVLYLPPPLRRRMAVAISAVRLTRAADDALSGRFEQAADQLADLTLLEQEAAWVTEALLCLAHLTLDAADEREAAGDAAAAATLREQVHQPLRLLEMRLERCSLDEEFYYRLHGALSRAGHPPEVALRALLAGIYRPVRDARVTHRLARVALDHVPGHPRASRFLGASLYFEGDYEAAVPHLRAATAGGQPTELLLGLSLVETEAREEGLALLARFAEGEKAQREALLALAEAAHESGHPEEAIELAVPVEQGGEPYRSKASALRARALTALDRLDEAARAVLDAADCCEPPAVEALRAVGAALQARGQEGDAATAKACLDEADGMEALPSFRKEFAFITSGMGQPALLAHDKGGLFFLGVHRRTGRQVLWRLRRVSEGEPGLPPVFVSSPYFLEACAAGAFDGRRQTVFLNPHARPLTRLLQLDKELAAARRPLLVSLAAAAADCAARGLVIGWVVADRILVGAEGGPALMPFDPWDDPRPAAGDADPPPASLAPELLAGGAAAATTASDVYGIARIARDVLGETPIPARLEDTLARALDPDPTRRPTPIALLSSLLLL